MSSSSRDKAPHITLKPSLKQDSTGKNLTIQCQIQASPKPEVNWLRENKPISNTNKTKMRIESNRGDYHTLYLDIFDLNVEDSGQYKVIAKNTLGEVSAVISLGLDGKILIIFNARVANCPTLKINLIRLVSSFLRKKRFIF